MPGMTEAIEAPEMLAALGEELRRERELRGVSLREISDATKISMRYLEALENGDASHLPAAVFVRGFVREYSRYLGLDADEMVDRYVRTVGEVERHKAEQLRREHPELRDYDPTINEGKVKAILTFLTILVVLAVLGGLAWYFRGALMGLGERFNPQPEGGALSRPAIESSTAAVPLSEPAVEEPPAPAVEPLRMRIEFVEPTWIHLLVDGETRIHDTVITGTAREFMANDQIEIRTLGNAGGVRITLDDREIGALGGTREVIRNRVFENPRRSSDSSDE